MTPEAALAAGFAAGVCALGIPVFAVAVRVAARARRREAALEDARAREAEVVASARRLAEAAREGRSAVHREIVAAAVRDVPHAEGVLLFAEGDTVLTCVHTAGPRYAYFDGMRVASDDAAALAARALRAKHRVLLGDTGVAPLHPGDTCAAAVPLLVEGGFSCVLVVSGRRRFDRADIDRLTALAERSVPAYQLACEREGDRRRAAFDALTGLLTPDELRRRLGRLVERAAAASSARVALLFVDTDRFKDWNDSYGHAAGDALLRALADVLRGAARLPDDLVARNGGDEFCLVFTDTEKAEAIERADLLRRRIGTLDLRPLRPAGAADAPRITASIGVASYPLDAGDARGLLERADAAMYHSKRVGRNAVAFVDTDGALCALRETAASNESERACRMST